MLKLDTRLNGVSGKSCTGTKPEVVKLTIFATSTVARDGDEIFLVSVIENDAKGEKRGKRGLQRFS